MYILTPENIARDVDLIPPKFSEDIQYSNLNIENTKNFDFYFDPLVYLESYNAPAIVLQVGDYHIKMPCIEHPNDWKIIIGEPEMGMLEAVSLEDINARDFNAFCFNPLSSFRPEYLPIKIVEFFPDLKWHIPTLPANKVLTVPIHSGTKPKCIYFVNGVTGRRLDSLDISDIL